MVHHVNQGFQIGQLQKDVHGFLFFTDCRKYNLKIGTCLMVQHNHCVHTFNVLIISLPQHSWRRNHKQKHDNDWWYRAATPWQWWVVPGGHPMAMMGGTRRPPHGMVPGGHPMAMMGGTRRPPHGECDHNQMLVNESSFKLLALTHCNNCQVFEKHNNENGLSI